VTSCCEAGAISSGRLKVQSEPQQRGAEARCGLSVVDLRSGDTLHWLRPEGIVEELYDVVILPGTRQPMALGAEDRRDQADAEPRAGGGVVSRPVPFVI
jgi:hypothetical protein